MVRGWNWHGLVAGAIGMAKAPVTANVKFTQNTRPLALGQGAWETVTGVRDYKLFVTDPAAGQVSPTPKPPFADRPSSSPSCSGSRAAASAASRR